MTWKDKKNPNRLANRNRTAKRAMRRLRADLIQAYGGTGEWCGRSRSGVPLEDTFRASPSGLSIGFRPTDSSARRQDRLHPLPEFAEWNPFLALPLRQCARIEVEAGGQLFLGEPLPFR